MNAFYLIENEELQPGLQIALTIAGFMAHFFNYLFVKK
jgi:DNA-binding XRE family transcriptional regulator